MGYFNINILHAESSCYAQDFLLSLQSFSFIPTIDEPTRVHNSSATLIDNILTDNADANISSGNTVSDISDHFSQFCVLDNSCCLTSGVTMFCTYVELMKKKRMAR